MRGRHSDGRVSASSSLMSSASSEREVVEGLWKMVVVVQVALSQTLKEM